ncbi:multifunctional CCA addition/repair protein [Mitsuaria sp. WAJ17]|uniref:multifunctional CCA addition/repair protein n=1 Tax=Mitsuaria sp. WAJ17 TaxID=2761452 RepID=UPI001603F976|nr:multifunctional CCA addition/repair protein [Mitsuaria sp. WAJ17]MBB2486662.1 multifunctional CCA addition/repair protein [Mitsuaria sp. WAJ17]
MEIYEVGGAVRDSLLGRPVSDHDWVVVGATPQDMLDRGFQPVGKDFPVFLHPQSHEEYALARTERKTAPGYHGFSVHAAPDVTLEQDLSRRDLTINAMARDAQGLLIDPHGGQRDLAARCLRHVSPAFAEDPVRILRLARFAARFHDFSVAPETLALMRAMVGAGEVDALVAERVWQELARGLMEARPSRMIEVLRDCGALARLAPELDRLFGVPQPEQHHPEIDTGAHLLLVLDQCAALDAPLSVRYACLCHDLGKGMTPVEEWPRHIGHEGRSELLSRTLSERWRVPNEARELAELVAREHTHVHQSEGFSAEARLRLLDRCDAWRRPERIEHLLLACECDARGRTGLEDRPYPQRERLSADLRRLLALDQAAISADALARGLKGPSIGQAIRHARLAALKQAG